MRRIKGGIFKLETLFSEYIIFCISQYISLSFFLQYSTDFYIHFSYIFETCKFFFFSPFLFNKDEQLHNRETTITFPPVITISFKTAMGKGNVLNTNVSNLFFPVKNQKKKKKEKKIARTV